MFDVYFDCKYNSEQLFHSMSVPNMARLAVAMVKKSQLLCFDLKSNSEQLSHSMSVPNMARLAVAMMASLYVFSMGETREHEQ